LLADSTSVGGAAVTVQAPANSMDALFVQVFDPSSNAFSGVAYNIDFTDVDQFDKASPTGAANNVSANASDLGSIVDVTLPSLTLVPNDTDWFKASMRAQ